MNWKTILKILEALIPILVSAIGLAQDIATEAKTADNATPAKTAAATTAKPAAK